ncbi:methyltransferase domain-containing protein [Streptomyces cacaoi]|uniref:methyltransferase domain-containing protein n=1 Tax=Streptomyces cacaoi TaxID=1898 RepID=UPI001FCF9242|nr:methyltransferase domain-containing protein [Streptomyces cacaoi]
MAAQPGPPLDAGDALALTERLVERIRAVGGLRDPAWHAAFARVPRAAFVPFFYAPAPGGGHERLWRDDRDPRRRARWAEGVASDRPLATRLRDGELLSSSSRPSLMARMLESLRIGDAGGGARHHGGAGPRVLEIGTGTGYNAALLGHRLGDGRVTTVDVDPVITEAARRHLAAAGRRPHVVTGDGFLGCRARAPYDRIIATCAVPLVPPPWIEQTVPGGLILTPLATGLLALRVAEGGRACGRFAPVPACFVPLRGGAVPGPGPGHPRDAEGPGTAGTPGPAGDFDFLLALAGAVPARGPDGRPEPATGPEPGNGHGPDPGNGHGNRPGHGSGAGHGNSVSDGHGPGRRELFALWQAAGRPGRERFGVAVSAGGRQWAWLDDPDGPHTWPLGRPAAGGGSGEGTAVAPGA